MLIGVDASERVRDWPAGTGFALRDWLRSRGYDPSMIELPKR